MSNGPIFPPPESANEDGIVAIGGELTPPMLVEAYRHGIFPWPISHQWPLAWFSPDPRGLIETNNFHIPKRLHRFLKKNPFKYSFNLHFKEVIKECANCNNRPGQTETWITDALARGYLKLHHMQQAYSVETYLHDHLVGGLYGVCLGDMVTAESMFFKQSNASKAALIYLLNHLATIGIRWLDIQMVTPITRSLGGIEVSRKDFLALLRSCNLRSQKFETTVKWIS